jgi:hypothetical protein
MRLDELNWVVNTVGDMQYTYVGQYGVIWRKYPNIDQYWISNYSGTNAFEFEAVDALSAQCILYELLGVSDAAS